MNTALEHLYISSLEEVDENEYSNDSGRVDSNNRNTATDNDNHTESSVSYYETFLIDLFGKEVADSFLHPVIDSSASMAGMSSSVKMARKTNLLNKKSFNVGRDQTLAKLTSNAERLWRMLRESSNYNIEKEDSKIGDDLKISFDAFARSCINRNLTPPQRGFVENKELMEIAKIVNNKRIEKSNLGRRKKQLMFNLSRVQQGNQALLMREKSFLASEDFDMGVKELFFPPIERRMSEADHRQTTTDTEDRRSVPTRGLRFFTADDSLAIVRGRPGQFRDRMAQKMPARMAAVTGVSADKSHCSGAPSDRKWSQQSVTRCAQSGGDNRPTDNRPVIGGSSDTTQWQPLTLGAVLDFTIARTPTFLSDDDHSELMFRQGSVRWWRPKLAQPL